MRGRTPSFRPQTLAEQAWIVDTKRRVFGVDSF